jgi:hypothetical protein
MKLRKDATATRISFHQKDWSWKELKLVFESLLRQHASLRRFCIFVDGLDEYNSDELLESTYEDEEDTVSESARRKDAGHTEIARFFTAADLVSPHPTVHDEQRVTTWLRRGEVSSFCSLLR